jgi:uncharacterized protein YlxW (UPF0749 family)
MATDTERRPDESMTLITTMLRRPLDPGYAAAAEARAAVGLPRAGRLGTPVMMLASILLGLLVGVGASSLRAQDTTKAKARAALISQITDRRASVDKQSAQIAKLQADLARIEAEALGNTDRVLQSQLATQSMVAGSVAVTGPGFVVTLDNAPSAGSGGGGVDPRTDTGPSSNTVLARDLQIVVNSLWEAGAEAISVNGLRLTSLSAIRFAGEAILVDFRPLNPPYVITSIGDPARLPRDFTNGPGGAYLSTLKSSYGIQVDTSPRGSVTVPAATTLITREARPMDTGSSPSPSPSTGGSP